MSAFAQGFLRDPDGALVVSGGTGGSASASDPRLKYAPPPQAAPTYVNIPAGGYDNTGSPFAATQDVVLVLPANAPVTGNCEVRGGRNIRIIGGKFAPGAGNFGPDIVGATGSVFMEGVEVDMSATSQDAINARGYLTAGTRVYPDVYLQNCRVTGVHGSQAGVHADVFQPQGPVGRLLVDKFTAYSNYEGFFISPQFPIAEARFSRTNFVKDPGNDFSYMLWLLDSNSETPYPTSFDDVWIKPLDIELPDFAFNSLWPKRGMLAADGVTVIGAVNGTDSQGRKFGYWPPAMRSTGRVYQGLPSGGDFVKVGEVGIGYVSPGYQADAPPPVLAAKGYVNHGSTTDYQRPQGYVSVEWVGSVQPLNWLPGDTWVDTTT